MTDPGGPTLADFLLARINDDEAVALEARCRPWVDAMQLTWDCDLPEETAAHILRFSPERMLTECALKRRLVKALAHAGDDDLPLRVLALPFAAHPDYLDTWRL